MPDETKDNQFVAGKMEKRLASLVTSPTESTAVYGEPNTGYAKNNSYNEKTDRYGWEYPKSKQPPFVRGRGGTIKKEDHTLKPVDVEPNRRALLSNQDFFIRKDAHFIRDVNQTLSGENQSTFVNNDEAVERTGYVPSPSGTDVAKDVAVFSGATTNFNPHNDPVTAEMAGNGGMSEYYEKGTGKKDMGTYIKPPISPMQPFTRMNSDEPGGHHTADEAIFTTYNRTKLPIADVAWRKGFRHIFITRPECYLMYRQNGVVGLCDQTSNDEDFSSAYTRMPHIVKLLSPWYVSGSYPINSTTSNWNFLFSNSVQGLSVAASTLSINENVTKSIEGFTITPAMHLESRQGSSIDLSFKDTKNLEVYEMARLWMLYMYKRKKGIFLPPYNGYKQHNGFIENVPEEGKNLKGAEYTHYHPYDRALEYCASLYDIVTNESGTKILYWCKYYGIYPTAVTPSLSNEANGPITDASTSITFKYHYRVENRNNILVEFNHDAGLTDDIGRINTDVTTNSLSFLLRNEYDNKVMPKYIGAAGMFTGSPYIVMARSQPDPLDKSNIIVVPNLRFMNLQGLDIDGRINLGITNTDIDINARNVVAYD